MTSERPTPRGKNTLAALGKAVRKVYGVDSGDKCPPTEVAELARWRDQCNQLHGLVEEREFEIERLRLHANSARVCLERFRVRPASTDLLATAIRELDDAMGAPDA